MEERRAGDDAAVPKCLVGSEHQREASEFEERWGVLRGAEETNDAHSELSAVLMQQLSVPCVCMCIL